MSLGIELLVRIIFFRLDAACQMHGNYMQIKEKIKFII